MSIHTRSQTPIPVPIRSGDAVWGDRNTTRAIPRRAVSKQSRVCILMGLHDGASDLDAQLDSFATQSWPAWDLIVGDDRSSDNGPDMVRAFAARTALTNRVELVDGPGAGITANYLGLIGRVPGDTDWLALSDQDDVWLPDRLSRGIERLGSLPDDVPALYCTSTIVTDATLGKRRPSLRVPRPAGFRNALVQNIASGNTILMNRAAIDLLRAAAPEAAKVPGLVVHDWWIYLLITGVGGTVIYDTRPSLLYRQHDNNMIGANDGWRARWLRIRLLFAGRFATWNSANIAALMLVADRLTPENRDTLHRFATLREKPLLQRLRGFARLGLYRQRLPGQIALWLAVLVKKV